MALKKDGVPQPSKSVNPGDKETEVEEEEQTQTIGDLPGYVSTKADMN